MFPGANAHIYRNEVGEVIGWDYPSYDDEPYYDYDDYDDYGQDEWCPGPKECLESGLHGRDYNTKGATWNDETLEWEGGIKECIYCGETWEEIPYEECEHGLSAWLCEGPSHYPMEY